MERPALDCGVAYEVIRESSRCALHYVLATRFADERFTITELRMAVQEFSRRAYDQSNFSRLARESGLLVPTAEVRYGGGRGRPAELYTYRGNA